MAALTHLQRSARHVVAVRVLHGARAAAARSTRATTGSSQARKQQQGFAKADDCKMAGGPLPLPSKLAEKVVHALEHVLAAGTVQQLHLGVKLPANREAALMGRLAAALAPNHSLKELSLAGSGAGDVAVQVGA